MLAVCALWFTVLKPKDPAADTAPLPTAPGTTGLSNDVNAAKGAAAASDAANAKVQTATGGTTAAKPAITASKPAKKSAATGAHASAAPATKKAATSADPAASLVSALDRKHAVVLLFWNRKGSDDRAVRRALSAVDRHHGHVVVRAVPVAKIGRYEAITAGAQV